MKELVLAAACQFDIIKDDKIIGTVTLVDNCHLGRNMYEQIKIYRELGCTVKPSKQNLESFNEDRSQGFIDNRGQFITRAKAYEIASTSGQLFNPRYVLPHNKLDSSCLIHIE